MKPHRIFRIDEYNAQKCLHVKVLGFLLHCLVHGRAFCPGLVQGFKQPCAGGGTVTGPENQGGCPVLGMKNLIGQPFFGLGVALGTGPEIRFQRTGDIPDDFIVRTFGHGIGNMALGAGQNPPQRSTAFFFMSPEKSFLDAIFINA